MSDRGLSWKDVSKLIKYRAAVFDAPVGGRTAAAARFEKEMVNQANAVDLGLLDMLPQPGTDLYRVMSWRARSLDEEMSDAA